MQRFNVYQCRGTSKKNFDVIRSSIFYAFTCKVFTLPNSTITNDITRAIVTSHYKPAAELSTGPIVCKFKDPIKSTQYTARPRDVTDFIAHDKFFS